MSNLKKHWYLVGHRAGARVFEQIGIKPELRLIHTFNNPEGRLQTRELVSDRQGRSNSSTMPGHTPVGSDDSPLEHVLHTFAKKIGKYLELELAKKSFDSIVIVAEPGVLGEIKKNIGNATADRLGEPVIRDLVHVSNYDMARQLQGHLCEREVI